jgi:hypothetical protein
MMRLLRSTSKVIIGFSLLAIIIVAANYAPLLRSHAEQDNCSFGPVSNAQYRSYLSEAKDRQRTKWPSFSNDDKDIERQLNFRLSDMLGEEKSIYVRIAMMHAILRAIGAEYLNSDGYRLDVHKDSFERGQTIRSNYQVDINRLVRFQLYPRQIWLLAVITDPTAASSVKRYGYQHFVAHILYFVDRPPEQFLAKSGQDCPPVPSAKAAARRAD